MKTKHALPVTMMAVAMLATAAIAAHPEAPLALNSSGDFVILAKTGISTVPYSDITGDMGVSPILATAITGFSLSMDPSGEFSTSAQVTGNIYAPDYMNPTPAKIPQNPSRIALISRPRRALMATLVNGGETIRGDRTWR